MPVLGSDWERTSNHATTRVVGPAPVVPYDLAVWHEEQTITAMEAKATYLALATGELPPRKPEPLVGFYGELARCFPEVLYDTLPPAPGSHNMYFVPLRAEVYVYPGGSYLSFPGDLAGDVVPLLCHLANKHGVVMYDRQRQAVFLPDAIRPAWETRLTAGDGFVVAHDPTGLELPSLLDAADQSGWFVILERDGGEQFLQAAPEHGPGPARTWRVEHHGDDRKLIAATGAPLDLVKQAFILYAMGFDGWRAFFDWGR